MKKIILILTLSTMSYGQKVNFDEIELNGFIEVEKKTRTTKKVITLNKKIFNHFKYIQFIDNDKVEILFDREKFVKKVDSILKERYPQSPNYIKLKELSQNVTSKGYIYDSTIIKNSFLESIFLSIIKDLILSKDAKILLNEEEYEKVIFFEKEEVFIEVFDEKKFEDQINRYGSYYDYFVFKTIVVR